ncbi:hypothetical protein TGAM01_v202976 [Trichoderma gamsii]|uniref:Prion-inhibition and propagation HeLo domain-containing protein n=1 Tax=Trichoderma gamsii TaxID=398673 RepID=A0A2P4ZW19_9HYPO|nr:hypothetical protein TGAM01_v202976 [Trichoderma gamsii]PON28482.1 hypothetical protein TGAM01_v202976 [Trichoderma gamsii]
MATITQNGTEQASDIAQLWQNAVEDYEKRTKKSLHGGQSDNIELLMDKMENRFKEFRHDKSKPDKVRNAFRNNLSLIQKMANAVQIAGGATSVRLGLDIPMLFDPVGTDDPQTFSSAIPAGMVSTAFGQVMQSFSSMSADYDKIIGFFEFTQRFLSRLSMIDDSIPQQKPLQLCVARVFSGMLTICSIAQEYAEKKRLKKWFNNLVDGSDRTLSAAVKDMEDAVNELNQTVGLTTFQAAKILGEVVHQMNENIDNRMDAIKTDTEAVIEQNVALQLKQDAMIETQQDVLSILKEQSRVFSNTVQSFGQIQMGANFHGSFKVNLLKLDVVCLRLARWGQSVGIANFDRAKSLKTTKLAPENREQVQNLLNQILELFADAKAASKRFEKRNEDVALSALDPIEELDGVSALLHEKIQDIVKKRQGQFELESDEWTLYEEKNFARLIEDIGELLDNLIELFPGIREDQRKLCEEEVSEMRNKGVRLSLIKDIAAVQDKLLSDTAAKAMKPATTYSKSVVFSGVNSGLQIGNNSGQISNIRFDTW